MLVHILGEVGTFYTVLLRVYPSTRALIFIEIGLYLTDTEHKIGWHISFETRCNYASFCSRLSNSREGSLVAEHVTGHWLVYNVCASSADVFSRLLMSSVTTQQLTGMPSTTPSCHASVTLEQHYDGCLAALRRFIT